MKRLLLLLTLTLTGVAVRAEQNLEDMEQSLQNMAHMFSDYVINHDKWELKYGGYRGDNNNFPKPSENQVGLMERMEEIRQKYWDAYKKGDTELEAAKQEFALILFYRDVYRMMTDIKPNSVPDLFRSKADLEANKGAEWSWQLWGIYDVALHPRQRRAHSRIRKILF